MAIVSTLRNSQDKRRWATIEQIQWLLSWLPEYMEAQQQNKLHAFWIKLFAAWFKAFPCQEPTDADDSPSESESDDESDVPPDSADEVAFKADKRKRKAKDNKAKQRAKKAAHSRTLSQHDRIAGHWVQKKQKQLKTFMRWHCPSTQGPHKKKGSTPPSPWFFADPANKLCRRLQETEAYIHLYYEQHIVQPLRAQVTHTDIKGPMINLIRKVAKDLYDADLEQVEPTPEQYRDAIKMLPSYFDSMLAEAAHRTGWNFTIIMGGPMPVNNGDIQTASITLGKNTHGATFKESYAEFERAIVRPYGDCDFLCAAYSSDMRAGRSIQLKNQPDSHSGHTNIALPTNTAPDIADDMNKVRC
ncbi:hypothetical protein FIBSPDRAFT_954897 [Athelia psychrophila]|uniref:Uncharacterized protein n=1 Tax=Athelia psychrophila TaxID=1759441 RepID=A0A166IPT4_9AGAM|nr:hypothetical protein FIBSPDRAFT_954897 [Fibularhizoctonia sp. CBS 109695]